MAERANYKPSTLAQYKSILNSYLLPEFEKTPLKQITDSQLKRFQVKLSEDVSPSRVNTVMQLLRSIFDQAQREGAIVRDPSKAVRRMQEPKVQIDPLSEQELAAVLGCVGLYRRALPTTIHRTCIHRSTSERTPSAAWGDVYWKKEQISITKGRVRGTEGLPKTKSSERIIPMTPPTVQALKELDSREAKVQSLEAKERRYVFTKPNGQPIDKHLDRIWARALRKAELRHRPSYQLRHTFATHCLLKGLPTAYVAKVLGHSTQDTLIRHYAGWIEAGTKEHDDILKAVFATNPMVTQKVTQVPAKQKASHRNRQLANVYGALR